MAKNDKNTANVNYINLRDLPYPKGVCFLKKIHKMGNSTSELRERERKEADFGEKIYDIVNEIYPESCENITGMLLEAEDDELERLLSTAGRHELEGRIHLAAKNLISASSKLISERYYLIVTTSCSFIVFSS